MSSRTNWTRESMATARMVQDRQEARDAKVLHLRYPCCSTACRYDLSVGDTRDVACSRCGLSWTVTIVAGSERGGQLAGRPIATAQWRAPLREVNADEAGATNPDLVKDRPGSSGQKAG